MPANYGIRTGAGIRVNDSRYRVDHSSAQYPVHVDSPYKIKSFLVDSPGGFTVNSPVTVDVGGSLCADSPSYNQPTLPGWQ